MKNDLRKFIVDLVGITNYRKVVNYPKHYIEYDNITDLINSLEKD